MLTGIFHAQTPYHVLAASSISLNRKNESNDVLVVSPDFARPEPLVEAIEAFPLSPFSDVVTLQNSYFSNKYERRVIQRRRISKVKSILKDQKFEDIFVFNTAGPTSQALLHFGAKQNSNVRRTYVEDGMAVYNSGMTLVRESTLTYMIERTLFGSWYNRVGVMGSSDRIDRILASFPESTREELAQKPINELDFTPLVELEDKSWLERYLSSLNDGKLPPELDALILLTHSNNDPPAEYANLLTDIITELREQGHSVGVKYHPREPNPGYIDLSDTEVTVLPRIAPAEAFYLLFPQQIQYVIGGVSTGLLTAFRFLHDPTVVSFSPLFGGKFENLSNVLAKFDIEMLENTGTATDLFRA